MTMFTRRCSRQLRKWRAEFASGFKILMMLVLLGSFFISNKAGAQCNSFGIDFKQAANRDNFDSYTTGEIHWIGSILQNSNSRYVEGMSTLQRLVFNNLPTACNGSCVHTLRVKLETTKGGNHAYDFITSWDDAFAASQSIAPGFGLMPTSRSDPKLHECGPDIGACSEIACNLVHDPTTGDCEDIPVIDGETNLVIPGDQNTTQNIIKTYECRYGDRTVRVCVDAGTFCGTPGDANNRVVFVGYGDANPNDGGTTYIYYDITWCSCSPDVVIEFGAHIAVGVDGLAATNPGGCNQTSLGTGYFVGQGASDINGGPYHVIVEDFIGADGTSGTACEPNLGNLDNQLQGSQVLLVPVCNETGPATACAGQTGLVYSSTNINEKDATYLWSIINSNQTTPATITSGNETTAGPITVTAGSVGSFTVRFIIKNGGTTNSTDDDISDTCFVTTTVSGGPTISCPSNTTVAACQTQAQVNAEFTAWLATASASGGTITNNGGTSGPSACGGSKTVTFSVTNTCGTGTCSASFTVTNAPTVSLVCPQNTTVASCQTQSAVNAEFAAWLATASSSGGCNGARSNNNTGAPNACGGTTTVTFTYTSSCTPTTTTCSASFTVSAPPAVSLVCPQNTTVASCQTQSAVNAEFTAWLATASSSGGCNGARSNNNTGAPPACGGSTTVTFTYTSSCSPTTTTCSASFTVSNPPAISLNCPQNTTVAAGQTQAQVDAEFAAWLATANGSGGCNGGLSNNNNGAPPACGGSKTVTFTYTSSCAPATTTCSATFTVTTQVTVSLTCPTATTVASCQTQSQVDAEFAAWLASVSSSGGTLSRNPASPSSPNACGGSTTVTWTVTNSCNTQTCSSSFTVSAPAAVSLVCPQNTTVASCQTQSAVNAEFTAWLATASASGGCHTGPIANNNTGAPPACGGSTTVTFTYTSSCAPTTTTCSASFTVTAPPAVSLVCPQNTTVASCQTQEQVNAEFTAWLATASSSGGCNGSRSNNNTGAPPACGGSTTVTFTYTSSCAPTTTTCSASFTVTAPPAVSLVCPQNTTVASCQTQEQVNAEFTAWLATASSSGGCNGARSNNNTGAPPACGGSTTVTFTYTSSCAPTTTTCSASFTVSAPPAVSLVCPQNTTVASCQTQSAVNAEFTAWLATASSSGGCNGARSNNNTGAPPACGGSTTVTFTYTSSCAPTTTTCSASFTVSAPPAVSLVCPQNTTIGANQSQAAVDAAFAAWLATAHASGGCNGGLSNTDGPAPNACGGSKTVTFTYTSSCAPLTSTCSATFTVPEGCATLCTYTQGYYGNPTGISCNGQPAVPGPNQFTTAELITNSLKAWGGTLTIGCTGHSVIITTADVDCVITVLPGGGAPRELSAGDFDICSLPPSYLKNGRINNVLLAQTITLGLNMGINSSLGNFALQANKWLVTADVVSCGSTTIKACTFNCTPNLAVPGTYIWTVATSPYHVGCRISQALYDALATKNVAGLYALANDALCNKDGIVGSENGISLTDINNAVDCINNAFDGCRSFVTWATGDVAPTANSFCTPPSSSTPCPPITIARPVGESFAQTENLRVTAYPNPFKSTVKFTIESNISGQAALEVYNSVGQRVGIVYKGYLQANRGQLVEYRAPRLGSNLIYILRVGNKQVTGKLLRLE